MSCTYGMEDDTNCGEETADSDHLCWFHRKEETELEEWGRWLAGEQSSIDRERNVAIRGGVPYCLTDGVEMDLAETGALHNADGMSPTYTFHCPKCGSEGYIE